MADEDPWKLKEDGYLNVESECKSIIYHPHLNIIFVLTRDSEVKVLDVNSGVILQRSFLSAKPGGNLFGTYLSGHDKVLFTDGRGLGVRRDYNGVMFLDSILQTPLLKADDIVKIELLLSEAILLHRNLCCIELPGVDQTTDVLQELAKKIKGGQSKPKKGTKAQKWNSVCLELPHCALKLVCAGMVQELKHQNKHIPALSIASAVSERLNCLLVPPALAAESPPATDRALMFSEAARRDTFVKWPHMNYKWALPDQMAQAGFYHHPNSTGDDRAMCFTCNVCLVCWEPTDEPWSEHERHSPSCPFVKGEYTQNVPLSVTYATAPAIPVADSRDEEVVCISTSSVPDLVATATCHGLVTIWNIARQLKKEAMFYVSLSEPVIMRSCFETFNSIDVKYRDTWLEKPKDSSSRTDMEIPELSIDNVYSLSVPFEDLDLEITALSIVGGPHQRNCTHSGVKHHPKTSSSSSCRLRPSFIAGISLGTRRPSTGDTWSSAACCSPLVRAMNDVNEASNRETAILDIMKVRDSAESDEGSSVRSCSHGRYPFLVVYNFHHYGSSSGCDAEDCIADEECGAGNGQNQGTAGGSSKKAVSGTGTSTSSGTRQEGVYQEIFLSKFMFDVVPGVDDLVSVDVMDTPPDCLETVEFLSNATASGASLYGPAIMPSGSPQGASGSGVGTACEGPMLNVTFNNVNGGIDLSKYPSTSEGTASPVIIKVRSISKKDVMNGIEGSTGNGNINGNADGNSNGNVNAAPVAETHREPVAIQCLPMPRQLAGGNLTVTSIHPTLDGAHIFVTISVAVESNTRIPTPEENDIRMDVDVELPKEPPDGQAGASYVIGTNTGLHGRSSDSACKSSTAIAGALLVYSLDLTGDAGEAIQLDEEPVAVRLLCDVGECATEVTLLPLAERDESVRLEDPNVPVKGLPQGLAAMVCRDGSVRVISLSNLKTVAYATPEKSGTRYVSAAYCNSLERLCVCTDKGSIHFFVMSDEGFAEECEDEQADICMMPSSSSSLRTPTLCMQDAAGPSNSSAAGVSDSCEAGRASSPTMLGTSSGTSLLANKTEFCVSDLRQLCELMSFENMTPCYAAAVPPCWSEIMQAQKQRRHPQHLQQGDDLQLTRTWRLQNDPTTWDEHVFEITLPRSCCIGHVDLKFTLHSPCSNPPNIQVTLLKQNATGIGRKEKTGLPHVDDGIDFNINMQCDGFVKGKPENPVTSEEYMRDHNCEVLCGPIILAQCLDLSEQGGTITLTSPKLFRVRSRTLLVHIKAVATEKDIVKDPTAKNRVTEEKGSASKKSRLDGITKSKSTEASIDYYVQVPRNTVDRLVTAVSKKMEYYLGCDWLHEVSITIRKTKQTNIPNERNQRCAMLESNQFVERLLRVVFLEGPDRTTTAQGLALDILAWVASVRLARLRSARGRLESHTQQLEFVFMIERHLSRLVQSCLLLAGRSIARKCVKLIIICSEGMKNASDIVNVRFDVSVLQALIEWLPVVSCCQTAGALRWFLLLLTRVLPYDTTGSAAQQCVALLQQVAQEMNTRTNPFHLLLRTRFGLYSTPFEPELFDTEPPPPAKFSSVPITYAAVVSGDLGGAGAGNGAGGGTGGGAGTGATGANGAASAAGGGSAGVAGTAAGTSSASTPAASAAAFSSEILDLRELLTASVGGQSTSDSKFAQLRLKGLSSNHYLRGLLEVEPLHFTCHAASDGTKMEKTDQGSSGFAGPVSAGNLGNFDVSNLIVSNSGTKKADNEFGEELPAASLPWQQLLTAPPQQTLLIERMHSGARRFVVLDFGGPVLLTDLMVPACSDLVSLSIDIWCQGEESDGQRLVVASDIGSKALVMSDLQPPPICRFLKITTIGRYGMSNTRCKIPIGSFYGHLIILPGENYLNNSDVKELTTENVQAHLRMLSALFEDIHCRYSLACAKLQEFLTPLLTSEIPNVVHMYHYLQRGREFEKLFPNQEAQKIIASFHECVTFQHQLNLVCSVIRRLETAQGKLIALPETRDTQKLLSECCTDKLRVLGEGLLDVLLYLVYEIGPVPRIPVSLYNIFDQNVCERLFHWLCVREDTHIQLSACTLLVRMCGMQPWWGDFLASTLSRLYCSQNTSIFPLDRVFILLTYLGRKSLVAGASRSSVLDSVLSMLTRLLAPLATPQNSSAGFLRAEMDVSQIGWVLLFLSVCLDAGCISGAGNSTTTDETTEKTKDKDTVTPTRWDFIQGEMAMQRKMASCARSNASRSYRRKLQKRLMHHKQHLEDIELSSKNYITSKQALSALSSQAASLSSKLEAALKQQEQFFRKTLKQHSAKHIKDIIQIKRTDGSLLTKQTNNRGSHSCARNGSAGGAAGGSSSGSRLSSEKEESDATTLSTDPRDPAILLPQERCLPVARGLVALVLSMDFTCNIDMFLLACKVIARIVAVARPAISLSELVTQEQLLHLIRLAVWNDQHKASWGGPWASHAISCLLQDILEGTRLFRENEPEMVVSDHEATPPPSQPEVNNCSTSQQDDAFAADDSSESGNAGPSTSKGTTNCFQLPTYLLESDDSELDEFLDDILERGRSIAKRTSNAVASRAASVAGITGALTSSSLSVAMDARLELGVGTSAEVQLRRLAAQGAHNLALSVTAPVSAPPDSARQSYSAASSSNLYTHKGHGPWQQAATPEEQHGLPGSLAMLSRCFDIVFTELQTQKSWMNMELVLELWLMLNSDVPFDPVCGAPNVFDARTIPTILVSSQAVSGLISALANQPGVTLRVWCLGFQCLTLMANQQSHRNSPISWAMAMEEDIGIPGVIVEDPQFLPMLLRFFSGTNSNYISSDKATQAGPSVSGAMREFLVCLQTHCVVLTPASHHGKIFKELLLELVYKLVQPTGALTNRQGPLDAQCELVDLILKIKFKAISLSTAINIVECVANLAYNYILSTEKIRCRSISEPTACTGDASSCFGGLFASVLGGETKQSKPATWDALFCNLLKLCCRIVQLPLSNVEGTEQHEERMDTGESHHTNIGSGSTSSERQESFMQQQSPAADLESKVPCAADTVLERQTTVLKLLSSLAGCSGSTLAMLLGSASPSNNASSADRLSAPAFQDLGEPLSVGDAVFQLLLTLSRKATKPTLMLQPLYDFLSSCNSQPTVGTVGVMQLSEPLLWFILRVLDTDECLEQFNAMGGVKVICENLVKSNQALINSHPSMVSVVMQHFSHIPSLANYSKKVSNTIECYEGLLNFAPLGNISASNLTAQPADVLIQSAPPHRRARTPAWSYHFYPDESWVELTLTLPCAVLLREVHLQPHITSLATCPSAVAVEVCRDCNVGLVPVCPPIPTSGLTFIRINLPQPEVVTSVLLRLYKPHDSSNIGLSQIRLLGSTTFGETAFRTINMDVPDEEQLTKSSLGWLRLLHHCLCVPMPGTKLAFEVASSASEVEGLPEACCGLLLVPAPAPSLFTPSLERVLFRLGLHSRDLGLKQINTLLRNGAAAFLQGSLPITHVSTINATVVDSVVELLYRLCTTHDKATQDRVKALLLWLQETASAATQVQEQSFSAAEIWSPSSAYVHCAAAILWSGHERGVKYDLCAMVTPELFQTVYKWTLSLPSHSALKKAIDTLLCAMCYIRPNLFPAVLQKTGELLSDFGVPHIPPELADRKAYHSSKSHSMTTSDLNQHAMDSEPCGQWFRHTVGQEVDKMQLSESQLMTLAMACQSPPAIQQLLDSGLPAVLTGLILEFCHQEEQHLRHSGLRGAQAYQRKTTSHDSVGVMDSDIEEEVNSHNNSTAFTKDAPRVLQVDTITVILKFFSEVCFEGKMRDWLGSPEGSVFWLPLLHLLCTKSCNVDSEASKRCEMRGESFAALESATIKFLSRCCWCHPSNQQLLSKVLCDVIHEQKIIQDVSFLHGISGFTRRLILQLLLENEKIFLFIKSDCHLQRTSTSTSAPYHPRYGVGHQQQLFYFSTQTTCGEIIRNVSVAGNLLPPVSDGKPSETSGTATPVSGSFVGSKKELWELGIYMVDQLSVQAGVTAKDKRTKDARNTATAATRSNPEKKSRSSSLADSSQDSSQASPVNQFFEHEACPGVQLPQQLQLSQLLTLVRENGESLSSPCLKLNLHHIPRACERSPKEVQSEIDTEQLLHLPGLATPLQVFTEMGGLALLAQHLPLVYPDTLRYAPPDKISATTPDQIDAEWVKVDDGFEDLEEPIVGGSTSPGAGGRTTTLPPPSVPPHSLAAFGLFLRLPGYAEVLLRDKKKAQCLLRLALGVTDDGEGGDIFSSPVANQLHTLPFQVLRQLFDSTSLTTNEGASLRRTTIEIGAIHLLLGCLSVFTHQSQDISLPGVQHELVLAATKASTSGGENQVRGGKSDDKSHLYWAKGTGFGTGSTTQSWNVEQALLRQRSEEEHVTVLLQVFSSYINPGGRISTTSVYNKGENDDDYEDENEESEMHRGESKTESPQEQSQLPRVFFDLLKQSCLLPAVSAYLRNDSVLDMARHIPLYRAVLQLLRAMALNPQLVTLLLPHDGAQHEDLSVVSLLTKMRGCVDTYASRLKLNKSKGNGKSRTNAKLQEEAEQDEGLALLIPDIQETANMVQAATERLTMEEGRDNSIVRDRSHISNIDLPLRSHEERYLEVMRRLQFDTFEMITESSEGGYQFVVSYHFESNVKSAGERSHPSRMKRLAQETVTLSTSLPLSYSSSVFVRCDADRLDIMKVLITGPAETPYANGCFEFDVYFPPDYPNSPMLINLETTGHHTIRFNPNLYNDGKVCLSVLNTWHGRPEEKWNAQTSSFLQVLVSIQSLILVPEPYFNEPGYERSRGTPSGNHSSREYNSNICQATVKWAMLEQVRKPCPCFKEVIHTHFWMKRHEIVKQIENWIADMDSQCGDRRTGRAISLNSMALKRHFRQLKEELNKLKTPEGLEDLADSYLEISPPSTSSAQSVSESKDASPVVSTPCQSFLSFGAPGSSTDEAQNKTTEESAQAEGYKDMELEKLVSQFCE